MYINDKVVLKIKWIYKIKPIDYSELYEDLNIKKNYSFYNFFKFKYSRANLMTKNFS